MVILIDPDLWPRLIFKLRKKGDATQIGWTIRGIERRSFVVLANKIRVFVVFVGSLCRHLHLIESSESNNNTSLEVLRGGIEHRTQFWWGIRVGWKIYQLQNPIK